MQFLYDSHRIPEHKSCVSRGVSVLSPEGGNVCLITVNNNLGKILRFAKFWPSVTPSN